MDLHRDPGHLAGHVRDVCRDRAQTIPRFARGHDHAHRRSGPDGRRAAARGDAELRGRYLSAGRALKARATYHAATTRLGRPRITTHATRRPLTPRNAKEQTE